MIAGAPIAAAPIAALLAPAEVETVTEALLLTDPATVTHGLSATVADFLALNSSEDAEAIQCALEALALTSTSTTVVKHFLTLSASLGLLDRVTPVFTELLTDTLELDATITADPAALVAIIDRLLLTGTATSTQHAIALLTDTLTLLSAATQVEDAELTDTLALVDTIEALHRAYAELVASAVFGATLTAAGVLTVTVDEALELDATVTPAQALLIALRDSLAFTLSLRLDDEPYFALAMNTASKGLTSYTNYAFNSMASFHGVLYGATDAGLFRLDGTTDDGEDIVWRIRTGLSNLGTGRNKGLDAAYIACTASGKIALKCIVVEPASGEKIVHWYEISPSTSYNPRANRILVGRGLRSVYWGFELTNVDAGAIELDSLELHPIIFEGRLP